MFLGRPTVQSDFVEIRVHDHLFAKYLVARRNLPWFKSCL